MVLSSKHCAATSAAVARALPPLVSTAGARAWFRCRRVQVSETTPLHRLETVYRRATEGLRTAEWETGAFRAIISQWLMGLEEEVSRTLNNPDDLRALAAGVGDLLEARLKDVMVRCNRSTLRSCAYHAAEVAQEHALAEG